MKTLISNLVITSILCITLVAVTGIVPQLSDKYLSYRSAKISQTQPGQEIPGHSYAEVMNNLFASSGR